MFERPSREGNALLNGWMTRKHIRWIWEEEVLCLYCNSNGLMVYSFQFLCAWRSWLTIWVMTTCWMIFCGSSMSTSSTVGENKHLLKDVDTEKELAQWVKVPRSAEANKLIGRQLEGNSRNDEVSSSDWALGEGRKRRNPSLLTRVKTEIQSPQTLVMARMRRKELMRWSVRHYKSLKWTCHGCRRGWRNATCPRSWRLLPKATTYIPICHSS